MRFSDGSLALAPNKGVQSTATEAQRESVRPSFEEVYAGEKDYIWRTVRRLGVPERHTEDVTHDVLLIVHRKLEDFNPRRPLRPWLFGIAMRVASDFRRTSKNAKESPRAHLDPVDDGRHARSADMNIEEAEGRALVYQALDTLNDDRRAVFILHEIDGDSIPTIAEALSIPVNTAYSRLRVAREEFAGSVRRLGGAQ